MRYLLSSYYSLYCYHIACFFSILLSLFHHVVFFHSKSHTHNSYTYTLSRENSTHSLTHPHSNFPPITVKHSLSYLLGRFLCFWIFFFPHNLFALCQAQPFFSLGCHGFHIFFGSRRTIYIFFLMHFHVLFFFLNHFDLLSIFFLLHFPLICSKSLSLFLALCGGDKKFVFSHFFFCFHHSLGVYWHCGNWFQFIDATVSHGWK